MIQSKGMRMTMQYKFAQKVSARFSSRWMWLIWASSKCRRMDLQSVIKILRRWETSIKKLCDVKILTTTCASILMGSLHILSVFARAKSSLNLIIKFP